MPLTTHPLRVLLLADTHLGFDLPQHPRVERRRRGPDFFARFEEALEPARAGEVDLVVHGGDLFHRSRPPLAVVERALAPLRDVAGSGTPVVLVPGNHERSKIPYPLLAAAPNLHLLDRPRTVSQTWAGVRTIVAGFPFAREVGGDAFARRVASCDLPPPGEPSVRLLVVHQAFEGAQVGTHDYTFRGGPEVVPARGLPAGFAAILTGHIHRAQILKRSLAGEPLVAPVIYPGSVERTSYVEREETKGTWLLTFEPTLEGGRLLSATFRPLAARPMHVRKIDAGGLDAGALREAIRREIAGTERDAVVRLAIEGEPAAGAESVLAAAAIRRLGGPGRTVEIARPELARAEAEVRR